MCGSVFVAPIEIVMGIGFHVLASLILTVLIKMAIIVKKGARYRSSLKFGSAATDAAERSFHVGVGKGCSSSPN